MSLSTDRQLTLYLGPPAGASDCDAASAQPNGRNGATQAAGQALDAAALAAEAPGAAAAAATVDSVSQDPDSPTDRDSREPLATAGTMQPQRNKQTKVNRLAHATAASLRQDAPAGTAASPGARRAETTPRVGRILLGPNSPNSPLPPPPHSSSSSIKATPGTGGPALHNRLAPAEAMEKPSAPTPAAAPVPGAAATVTAGGNGGVTQPARRHGLMLASNHQQELLSVPLARSAQQQPAAPMHCIPKSGDSGSSNRKGPLMLAPVGVDLASNQPPAAAPGQHPVATNAGLTPSKRPATCVGAAIKQEQPEGGHVTVSSSHMPLFEAPALHAGLLHVIKQEAGGSGPAGAHTAAAAINKKPRLPPQPGFHQLQQQQLQPALVSPPGATMVHLGHQQHQRQAGKAPAAMNIKGHGTATNMAALACRGPARTVAQLLPHSMAAAASNRQPVTTADVEMMESPAAGHRSVAAAAGPGWQPAAGATVEPGTIGTGAGQVLLSSTLQGRSAPRAVAATRVTPAGLLSPAAQLTAKQGLSQEAQPSKQVTVFDLTLDSDEELDGSAMHDAELPHTAAVTVAAAPAEAGHGALGQQVAAEAPSSLSPATAAPALAGQLPPGLQLQDAGSPRTMEQQLVRFVRQGLRDVLPREQYCSLMDQLLGFFEPLRQQGAADADQQEQLQCMYTYVQAAVDGGQLKSVLTALKALIAAGS